MDVPIDSPVDLDGVKIHYFRVPALRRLWWAPGMDERLRHTIRDFDAVHVHAVFLLPMRAAARAAARARVPYIVTPRGMLMRDVIQRKSRWVKHAWIHLVERKTLAEAGAVHVTAELEGAELAALGLPARRVECIPNGVQWPQQFVPLSAGPFASLPESYALFLSRLSWKKGLERLITAWQWVPELPLVIAGTDDERYQPKLQELARRLGLGHRVLFVGPASDEHKWALYRQARLFILPSYSENFGNVVAEAMAMGCPVVVTPEVGIAALVESSGAGVVTPGDPRVLAEKVCQLLADPARLEQMGSSGKRAAQEHLSWDAVAARAETLYRRVMDEN